jgi:hypothetical protein
VGRGKYSQLVSLAKHIPGMTLELGHGHGSARIALSAITKATFVASVLVSTSVSLPQRLSHVTKGYSNPSTSKRKLVNHHKAHSAKTARRRYFHPRIRSHQ